MKFQVVIKTPRGEYVSKVMDDTEEEGGQTAANLQCIEDVVTMNLVTAEGHAIIFPAGVIQQSVFKIVPLEPLDTRPAGQGEG